MSASRIGNVVAIACLLILAGVGPATAQSYSCVAHFDPFVNFDTCNGTDVQISGYWTLDQRRAVVDLNAGDDWQYLVVRVDVCSPTGWVVHIGDSPTNDGYAGDSGSTQHDAEIQWLNGNVTNYHSDIGGSGCVVPVGGSACSVSAPVQGCITQQYYVDNELVAFFRDATIWNVDYWWNQTMFDFPPYDEADSQDPSGQFEDKVYVGLNRTFGSASRSGTGAYRACFFLKADKNFSNADITAACGF